MGKSTISANLTVALAKCGLRPGLLDADLFGPSIPRLMGLPADSQPTIRDSKIEPMLAHGVQCMSVGLLVGPDAPIVWRGLMVMKAMEQLIRQVAWPSLPILIIDMPPGTGDTQLSLSQMLPISGAIIVGTPQDVALSAAKRGIEMFRKVDIPILGLVSNMSSFVCGKCQHVSSVFVPGAAGGVQGLAQNCGVPVLAEFPLEPSLASASDAGVPIVISQPDSATARAFMSLAESLISMMKVSRVES